MHASASAGVAASSPMGVLQESDRAQQIEMSKVAPVEEEKSWVEGYPGTSMLLFSGVLGAFALPIAKGLSKTQAPRAGTPQMADGEKKTLKQKIDDFMPGPKEAKKVMPLAFMFFCMLFNYTMLRDTKDVLVVTAGGAEVIPFLKTYANLPAAIGFTVLYSNMTNKMSNANIFYSCLTFFTLFFGSFALFLYPNRHMLHPIGFAAWLSAHLPANFGPIISIIKYWTFSAFYVTAELWGSVVVSLLFWGFANEVCSVREAKRWYPLFGMLANVALIFSGQFVRYVSDIRTKCPPGVDAWGVSLNIMMTAVVIVAGITITIFRWMQNNVVTDPECVPQNMERKKKKEKVKMGLRESFSYLTSSSYIRNLAFLVIAYGVSINIVEVTWKGKLKQAFPNPNDYSSFMGTFSTCTGSVTLFMMVLSRWILQRFGWGIAALITPVMLGLTGITFFSLILFPDAFSPISAVLGVSPLMLCVIMGAAQNILSKASKYSLFDPCKETAYIPLDNTMKTKGKAAIDVIGNPLGKSGGSLVQQIAIISCGSLAGSAPLLGFVLFGMVGLWMKASRDLAVEFEEKSAAMEESESIEVEEKKEEPEGTQPAAA